MELGYIFIVFAALFSLTLAWSVGANDLANVMSATMGSRAINLKQAIFIAVLFEFAGAFLGGTEVTHTLRSGIINTQLLNNTPQVLLYGMLAVLLAGTTWMTLASYFGLPVSITNTIVGALVGLGAIVLGLQAIHWQQVGLIALSWLCSPLLAGIIAYVLILTIQRWILGSLDPVVWAQRLLPVYLFLIGIVLTFMTVFKALQHFGVACSFWLNICVLVLVAFLMMLGGTWLIKRPAYQTSANRHDQFAYVEKLFALLVALTTCAMVFAHGSNDVAIVVGPLSAVIHLVNNNGETLLADRSLVFLSLFFGSAGVIVGFLTYGKKVIATVGNGITALTPTRAFAATFAAAVAVVLSTSTGIPVSATLTLIGGVLGVGLARGIGALNLNVVRLIGLSWFLTIPVASLLAIGYFYLLKMIFN